MSNEIVVVDRGKNEVKSGRHANGLLGCHFFLDIEPKG
jgi:hypothetical protein